MLPCLIFEDEHLLVVNKPAGLNTHAPHPYAGEGLYDWLRNREPRWADLAVIQRLDKETSGVMVFGKSALANRSLTRQFTRHTVCKRYVFLTDRTVPGGEFVVKSELVRQGEKYVGRPVSDAGKQAETSFRLRGAWPAGGWLVEAWPLTGRTHQIRVHAAESGVPVLGDRLYGGTPAARIFLHAEELLLEHPQGRAEMRFHAPVDFASPPRMSLRMALLDPETQTAYRLIHGAADGWPGWYVDRAGDFLLSESEFPLSALQATELLSLQQILGLGRAFHKLVPRVKPAQRAQREALTPGENEDVPAEWFVRENGLRFVLRSGLGQAAGLFLDQRDNRRRLLTGHIAAGFPLVTTGVSGPAVLNTFAYTCGFSVCAAKAGARVTNVDLSAKYLDWGRRNFALNSLDASPHEFLEGDVFDWIRRLGKKGRRFDVIILDPPTFSRAKQGEVFQAERDYGRLVSAALPLVRSEGVLFVSTNAGKLNAERFVETVAGAIGVAGRSIRQAHYAPQPPDFPITRAEPPHLKTVWMRIG